jgi:N,N'-diacetyllegionaminate synthase
LTNYKELNEVEPAIIIAEAGINHDGDTDKAKLMIDVAARSQANYCKFQSFKASKLVTPTALTSSYIDSGSHKNESFRELLSRLELNERDHYELRDYCLSKDIKFLSTAFDNRSFDFLVGLGIDIAKVASGNVTNIPLLRHIASSGLPIYLSTGMASLSDIEDALAAIEQEGNNQIVLLHCISWYPAEIKTTNLKFMATLKSAFGYPVGYSDHTLGINMTIAARALGAVALEKHFTLNSKDFGPDHLASIEEGQLNDLVKGVREVELGLGVSNRVFSKEEIGQRDVHRTSIVVNKQIIKGDIFTFDNLTIKRPGIGIKPKYLDRIMGCVASADLGENDLLEWNHVV